MTIHFVSRHSGARNWLEGSNIKVDRYVTHLDLEDIRSGDTVIGTLPVNIASDVYERGASYVHLSLEVPESYRGKELSSVQMNQFKAKLQEFAVTPGKVWQKIWKIKY